MAELFKEFSDFKAHVGGAISQTLELSSLAPVIYDTARRHITPYLSMQVYEALVADYDDDSLSNEDEVLLPLVQRTLALLTMHEYAKVGGVEFSEGGIHRNESENRKSAYRYQEKEYSLYMIEKGYDALEAMLLFLDNNMVDYPEWGGSAEASAHLSPLFNYARDFRLLLNVQCDRYSFECLKPIIADVQAFGVQTLLPKSFWDGLSNRHLNDALSDIEKELVRRIRMAIGHRAMDEALKQHWVKVSNGRVSVTEEFGEQNQYNRTSPNTLQASIHHMSQELLADRHTTWWRQFILDNPEEFPEVFDEASGGTNDQIDAWHINTADEQLVADCQEVDRKKQPVVWL